eukprot:gnl/MRDRNA2_/MRDRNA2_158738_c0_seq1.p1 gnl/MRDRNA2_/MRDRNA2_158738_c0~~gnl/MRDRNA2_/MRDRNA2_158738_c0_seq1.p1  ORF type:complete len:684 (+),score=96.86 gnl/MRDRNA2_/MRDRNA2_158738_c0_seq1:185-2053(+)
MHHSIDNLADKLLGTLADTLFDRALPLHRTALDGSMLRKPGHLANPPRARLGGLSLTPGNAWKRTPLLLPPPFALSPNIQTDRKPCPFTGAIKKITGNDKDDKPKSPEEQECIPIPGPKGLPADILQNSYHVMKIPVYGIEEATLRWGQSFGPIVRFDNANLGIKSWVFVNEPKLIEHVCGSKAQNYAERYLPDIYRFATESKGILGSSGAFNKKHRAMCKGPFTSLRYMQQFAETTTQITRELTNVWRQSSDSGIVVTDVSEDMQRLTLDVIGKVAFSYDFGGMDRVRRKLAGTTDERQSNTADQLMGYVNTWMDHVGKLAAPWITQDMLELGTKMGDPRLNDLRKTIEGMRGILFEIIDERRQKIRNGDEGVPSDLMTSLIKIQQEEGMDSFTDTELWEDIHDVMGAGHETTANTLSSALWEISMHPEVGVKIQDELDALCGVGPNRRLPTYDDWESGKLAYTTMVVKEVLRLYPSIPLFVRESEKDDKLPGGYVIQGGDTVFMSAYALGRTERFWPNPYRFDPERFTPEEEAKRARYTWLPFGAGPRMCLGARFALMSTVLELATIMQDYSFTAVKPNYRSEKQSHIPYIGAWRGGMPFEYDMTIAFPEGCTLQATPRN